MQIKSGRIYVLGFVKGFCKALVILMLFYRHTVISLAGGILFGIFSMLHEKKTYAKKQRERITVEFREGMQGIASALSAGYSIENAFAESRKDLILLYGKDSVFAKEIEWITQQTSLNQPIEKVLMDFAMRWNVEDILHFAQVFETAKRTGGDLIAITRATAEKISQKMEVNREIQTMLAGKRMEGMIMNYIPLGIIAYFWVCSPDFLNCMYVGSGRIVMTILLGLYLIAYEWSKKICTITV